MTNRRHNFNFPEEFTVPHPRENRKTGKFISLEGPEGAGKTTQLKLLEQTLSQHGFRVLAIREPGGTELGEEVRRLVKHLHGENSPCSQAELLLLAASRAQLVQKVIRPALAAGLIVLCDRFRDSTTAYQGYGRGLELALINRIHQFTIADCQPDLTILLDLDVTAGAGRIQLRGLENGREDRFESEHRDFHERVRAGFLTIAQQEPARIKVVDGARPANLVQQEIMHWVARLVKL